MKVVDIIKAMRGSLRNTRVTNVEVSKKVINEYFSIAKDMALCGYRFDLKTPKTSKSDLGFLVIHRRMMKNGEMPKSLYKNQDVFNPYTIGEKYTIDFISEIMEKRGMVFKASSSFTKRLSKILYSNKGKYRLLN
jgi:hypothetical protein